jgi:hypothetical protein
VVVVGHHGAWGRNDRAPDDGQRNPAGGRDGQRGRQLHGAGDGRAGEPVDHPDGRIP